MNRHTEYVEGYVVGTNGNDAYFVYTNLLNVDIIVDFRYCPRNKDMLGRWIRAAIQNHRAIEPVEIIDDVFPSRICKGLAELKVEVKSHGKCDDGLQMFHNKYFNFISDPRKIVKNLKPNSYYSLWIVRHIERGVNVRWRISIEQDSIEPIENDCIVVSGLVHSFSRNRNFYFLWATDLPKTTVCIETFHCPSNTNMVGKWVQVEIDAKNRSIEPVKILQDFYETRVRNQKAEVRVNFRHSHRIRNDYEMFYHNWFKNIFDSSFIIENCVQGSLYKGWIEYQKIDEVDARWELVANQHVEGPLKDFDEGLSRESTSHSFANQMDGNRSFFREENRYSMDRSPVRRHSRSPARSNSSYNSSMGQRSRPRSPSYSQMPLHRDSGKTYKPESENGSTVRNPDAHPNFHNTQTNEVLFSSQNANATISHEDYFNPHSLLLNSTRMKSSESGLSDKEKRELRKYKSEADRVADFLDDFMKDDEISNRMKGRNFEQYQELMELLNSLRNISLNFD